MCSVQHQKSPKGAGLSTQIRAICVMSKIRWSKARFILYIFLFCQIFRHNFYDKSWLFLIVIYSILLLTFFSLNFWVIKFMSFFSPEITSYANIYSESFQTWLILSRRRLACFAVRSLKKASLLCFFSNITASAGVIFVERKSSISSLLSFIVLLVIVLYLTLKDYLVVTFLIEAAAFVVIIAGILVSGLLEEQMDQKS